jgi:hypothetical protein
VGAGAGFIFHPWVICGYPKFQILMVSVQPAHLNSHQARSFGPAQQYPLLMSYTITLGAVHLTHQLRSSLGALIRHGLVIEFTSTLLKSAGDPKPARNPMGADVGVTFHPQVKLPKGFGIMVRRSGRIGLQKSSMILNQPVQQKGRRSFQKGVHNFL